MISGSVGQDGVNRPADVRTIQAALESRGFLAPGGYSPGVSDAALIAGIRRYQRERAGFRWPDGRVDVDNRTIRALNGEEQVTPVGTLPDPTNAPLGTPLVDDPDGTGASTPLEGIPPLPPSSGLPDPDVLFPDLAPGAAAAAYLVREGRILGFAYDTACGGDPDAWTIERGLSADAEGEQPRPSASSDVRARIAAIADQYPGYGYAFPETRAAYASLLFPHDTAANQDAFARSMSSCGLFAMAVLRELGKRHSALDTPYASQIGMAVTNIVRIARADGAWVSCETQSTTVPRQGDMVIVGNDADPAWGGLTHVMVVTGVDGDRITSVDGGQPHVAERTRTLSRRGGHLWIGGRRVYGFLDAGGLKLD